MKTIDRKYILATLCLVLVPNLIISFNFAGLLHDDSSQMWFSSMLAHKDSFGEVQYLNSFREDILFHIALYASPQLARAFIVCIYLCGSSLILFKILRSYYDASLSLAMLASVMPFLTLSVWHIPVGINISYVAGDVLFCLMSIWLICFFLKNKEMTAFDPFVLFCVYILMAETQRSSVITAPIVFMVAITWGPTITARRFFASLVTVVAIVSVVTAELAASRKARTATEDFFNNLSSLWSHSIEVLEPAIPFSYWGAVLLLFFIIGVSILIKNGFLSLSKTKSQDNVFRKLLIGNSQWSSLCVVLSGLLWSLIPYALTFKNLDPLIVPRFYFIWQFFFWLTISLGLIAMLYRLQSMLYRLKKNNNTLFDKADLTATIVMLLLILASWGKSTKFDSEMVSRSNFILNLKPALRNTIQIDPRPNDQALLLIDKSTSSGIPHITNHLANSGYLNYLVRPQNFNFTIFAEPTKCSSHFNPLPLAIWGVYSVDGFSLDRPLAVYQYNSSDKKVSIMDYLIDASSGPSNETLFTLYKVDQTYPKMVSRFDSREKLLDYLELSRIPVSVVAYGRAVAKGGC